MERDQSPGTFRPWLGDLASPDAYTDAIELGDFNRTELIQQLKQIATIRIVEEIIGDGVKSGAIRCPCHLAIGQEAIPVAMSARMHATDRVLGTHRSHGHFLAQGGTPYELFAEVLGKATGCSRGMGGSMHLYKASTGFIGSVPIVSATVSLAVGAALAAKQQKTKDIAVAYFGDGAMEEGPVHESLNFSSVYKLPMIFVVENNLFSSHLHIRLRQPHDSVARFAAVNDIAWEVVDGNDLVALGKATQRLIDRARRGEGPGFLEAVTYRWRGHVGPSEDIDVGVQRKDDLAKWKKRDPIRRTIMALEKEGVMSFAQWETETQKLRQSIEADWEKALKDPYPPNSQLMDTVYAHPAKTTRGGYWS